MNAFALTVLSAALVTAIVELMAPKGEGGRLASHVRMIAGLFLLVALLDPLREGVRFLRSAVNGDLTERLEDRIEEAVPRPDPGEYQDVLHQTLEAVSREETEAWVVSALETVFAVPPEHCTVEAVCLAEDTAVTLQEVRIALSGEAFFKDPHPIEAYVTAQLRCPCYVTVQL